MFARLRSHGMLTHERLPFRIRTPNGIRTRATGVKGQRPRPLDDGGPPLGSEPRSDWDSIGEQVAWLLGVPTETVRSVASVGKSGVPEVVQGGIIDSEVVRDLMYDGDPHLLDQLLG